MLQFLVRRLIVAILVAATVMMLAFIPTRLSGDLAISIAGPNATQANVGAVRKAVMNLVAGIAEPRCSTEASPFKPRPAGGVECLVV